MLSIALLGSLARMTPHVAPRLLVRWLAAALLGGVFVFGVAHSVHAAEPAARLDPALVENVRSLALANTPAAAGLRVELEIGSLDPRLHLAPCQKIEPYLPAGMRLWGKARIGLRCREGAVPWNVYLPITVKVYGRAVVVPAGAIAGSVLTAADLSESEVDLAGEYGQAVVDPKLAEGRVVAQTIRPGQTLRLNDLKARQWFAAGEMVKVVAAGAGFSLEAEAQALNNGVEGLPARVRMDSGRIITGMPTGERRVEVEP